MRPLVAVLAQLADEAALGGPKRPAEHVVPRLPHELEQRGHVPFDDGLSGVDAILAQEAGRLGGGCDPGTCS